ncbi:MAG TPA: ExeM/NucH family extracellular endonuclease, partial [Dermatophilaceae bacterium]|nr:ExeM/NucH family extracellular endonuclease [Dermatophilaceae bacterium]
SVNRPRRTRLLAAVTGGALATALLPAALFAPAAAAGACDEPSTPIPTVQGSGATVAVTGPVTVQGVVVGDYEGPSPALRGFFVQDPVGDGDPATSDGIFVFEGSNADAVTLGDVVRVTGTAGENQGQSQVSAGTVVRCAQGTGTVAPTDVTLPVAGSTALERVEGMLVRLPQRLAVTEHFQLGRFGQVVLTSQERLRQPTDVVPPGPQARALQAANDLDRLVVDDASQAQNPDPVPFGREGRPLSATNTLRGGDTATGAVGVMTFTWAGNAASGNAYRLRPLGALGGAIRFQPTNPRPAGPPAVGGGVRVAGMNLLNWFDTVDGLPDPAGNDRCTLGVGGAPTDCRGADTAAELERQAAKTVSAVLGTGASVVGSTEVENDGYGADSALADIVRRLDAATAPGTWAFVDADAGTGTVNALGADAIKVALLYRPADVTPVGRTAALATTSFLTGGDSSARNRAALAQAFRDNATGGTVVATVNHLKSKGSACDTPDTGDGQGNCAAVRTAAAGELAAWLGTDPTGAGDDDVLVLGDLNSYAREDPVQALRDAGLTDLLQRHAGADSYSYAFDGQWGRLDHALASSALTGQVTGAAEWHVNADEPSVLDYNLDFKTPALQASLYAPDAFRAADHDPVLVGLDLTNAAPAVGPVTGPVEGPGGSVRVGQPVTVTAPFTDADRFDGHTATVDWGDGTTTPATVTDGTVTATHTYAAPGLYRVTVTVTDSFGNAGSACLERLVVVDPAAGRVTGGGWVQSPAGAVVGAPDVAGKAAFEVSAHYARDGSRLDGTFSYRLPAGGLALETTSLDWLVVRDGTARLSGPVRIVGVPGARVEVTLLDGGRSAGDVLHVVVTDPGGRVTYDSGRSPVRGQVSVHG